MFFLVSENAKELSVLDALKYFKATPEELAVERIEQHHNHVEKALRKFHTIQEEEIKNQEFWSRRSFKSWRTGQYRT